MATSRCLFCNADVSRLRPHTPAPLCCRVSIRIDVRGDDECWPWTGRLMKNGYPVIDGTGVDGKPELAHRLAYRLAHGGNPEAVRHSCDNPPCCNFLRHLVGGTQLENIADAVAKGRNVVPEPLRGETAPQALLTEKKVRQIRELYASGRISQREVGERFGVSRGVVCGVVMRKTWRHVA